MNRLKSLTVVCLLAAAAFFAGCNEDEKQPNNKDKAPEVATAAVTNVTATTATAGGNIADAGTPAYTERGVVYGTTANPTIDGNGAKIVVAGSGTGSFTTDLESLTPATTYYVRAYATNENGTAYGEQVSFTTLSPSRTVTIGEQVGTLIVGIAGTVTFPLITTNFTDGTYVATPTTSGAAAWPYGMSVQGDVVINNNIGILTIAASSEISGIARLFSGMRISLDGTPSTLFTLTISEAEETTFPGSGTSANPYLIGTAEELEMLAELVNVGDANYNDKYYKLTADIDLGVAPYNAGEGWMSIGRGSNPFRGHFDGNNHKVSGLYISASGTNNVGLFGNIDGGTVKNLGVEGGIRGSTNVGGLAGIIRNGSITNCYASVMVSGSTAIGGLVGDVTNGSVTNCYATGDVTAFFTRVGGLVGNIFNGSNITNSFATGNVISTLPDPSYSDAGGLVGGVFESNVTNCYAVGSVNARNRAAGIVGLFRDGRITHCAALNPSITRNVNATWVFSRVVGAWESSGGDAILSNNVAWVGMIVIDNIITTGNGLNQNGADVTSVQAKTQATYTGLGWKFGNNDDNPWKWVGGSYPLPVLYWQSSYPALPGHLN